MTIPDELPEGWEKVDGGAALHKTFSFCSFDSAFDFMKRCEPIITDLDHHPEWLNIYNKVVIRLTTHDVGGLSERDYLLADAMNALSKT